MLRRLVWTVSLVMVLPLEVMGQTRVLRIVDRVQPACGAGADDSRALVVVNVVDVRGEPMAGITVELSTRRRAVTLQKPTDAQGRATFTLSEDAEVRLSAGHVGFATSTAERAKAKRGCISAVTLPLEVEPPRDIISDDL